MAQLRGFSFALLIGLSGCQAAPNAGNDTVFSGYTENEICEAYGSGRANDQFGFNNEALTAANVQKALQQRGYTSGSCTEVDAYNNASNAARGHMLCQGQLNSLDASQRGPQSDIEFITECLEFLGY
jgi:hypothetical protein